MIDPLVVDEEFFFAVLPRDATSVQIVARGSEDFVMKAGARFLEGLPAAEVGRYLFGNCSRGLSRRELVAEVTSGFRLMPKPSWTS